MPDAQEPKSPRPNYKVCEGCGLELPRKHFTNAAKVKFTNCRWCRARSSKFR